MGWVWYGLGWYGLGLVWVWFSFVWYGMVCYGMVWYASLCFILDEGLETFLGIRYLEIYILLIYTWLPPGYKTSAPIGFLPCFLVLKTHILPISYLISNEHLQAISS